jgi:hypothetical protein
METAAAHSFGYQARNITDAAGQAQLPEVAVLRQPPKSVRRTECPLRVVGSAARPLPREVTLRAL